MTAVRLVAVAIAGALVTFALPGHAAARPSVTHEPVLGREITTSVDRERVVELPMVAAHVALHWRGDHETELSVAFSADGRAFGDPIGVEHDDTGGPTADGRTFGAVLWTGGARFVRIVADRPLAEVSVVAISSRGPTSQRAAAPPPEPAADSSGEQPAVISRAEWGADESTRFDEEGMETWPAEFFPVQKFIVHHTAGINDDPDPVATIRAIGYYHAVTRGWDDIGYNFLIDESGRIYEGRYSRPYEAGEWPTGEDLEGNSVAGAHVGGHNAGTVGIALLGTLSEQDATPAAREALIRLLAWKTQRHGIDPMGTGTYTNPVTGVQKGIPHIAGHRDLAVTECPGPAFHATLPALRRDVAGGVPGASELTARTASRPGIRLRWTVPSDAGRPIEGYRILRRTSSGFSRIATVPGTKLGYRDRAVPSGGRFTYVVRAVDAVGAGPRSNRASAVAR